jgi:signal transduction histidine kinase
LALVRFDDEDQAVSEKQVKILLIEDSPDDVVLLKHILAEHKNNRFDISHAGTLTDAIKILETRPFNLILLDLSLPESEGLDTFAQVHNRFSSTPIIVLTGLADEEAATLAVRLGAQDYLIKDEINQRLLTHAIHYAIERKGIEETMLAYQKKLRSMASELCLAEERERRRIATELHDHIGQNLAISRIKLGLLRENALAGKFKSTLDEIQSMIDETIHYTRSLTFELSPPLLYEFGFEAAVEWLSERLREQYHLNIAIENDQAQKPLSDDLRVLLFQAVRELLYNVVKHADTHDAMLSIGKDAQFIRVTVEDRGRGFNPDTVCCNMVQPAGFGLFNIRERLKNFGGKLEIKSAPGEGTTATLFAPLRIADDQPNAT